MSRSASQNLDGLDLDGLDLDGLDFDNLNTDLLDGLDFDNLNTDLLDGLDFDAVLDTASEEFVPPIGLDDDVKSRRSELSDEDEAEAEKEVTDTDVAPAIKDVRQVPEYDSSSIETLKKALFDLLARKLGGENILEDTIRQSFLNFVNEGKADGDKFTADESGVVTFKFRHREEGNSERNYKFTVGGSGAGGLTVNLQKEVTNGLYGIFRKKTYKDCNKEDYQMFLTEIIKNLKSSKLPPEGDRHSQVSDRSEDDFESDEDEIPEIRSGSASGGAPLEFLFERRFQFKSGDELRRFTATLDARINCIADNSSSHGLLLANGDNIEIRKITNRENQDIYTFHINMTSRGDRGTENIVLFSFNGSTGQIVAPALNPTETVPGETKTVIQELLDDLNCNDDCRTYGDLSEALSEANIKRIVQAGGDAAYNQHESQADATARVARALKSPESAPPTSTRPRSRITAAATDTMQFSRSESEGSVASNLSSASSVRSAK